MAKGTSIEWSSATWNPVTGCKEISAGCLNCYARKMANRLQKMGQANYRNGFEPTCHPHELDRPKRWTKPERIFVCSMADLFHSKVPDLFIHQVFHTMQQCPQHTFMVLTKRTQRLARIARYLPWPPNVWCGVSVESRDWRTRLFTLRGVPAAVRFVSAEPLLESLLPLDLTAIHQVIVGGESGHGARPMNPEWARELRDECARQGSAFFMKQMGGRQNKRSDLADLPEDLRIRNWPEVQGNGRLF